MAKPAQGLGTNKRYAENVNLIAVMFFSAMKPDQETSLAVAKRDPLLGRR